MNRAQKVFVRRALSITLYVAAFVVVSAAFVPLLIVCAVFDVVRGKQLVLVRTLLVVLWYLACEVAGIAASAWIWLAGRELAGGSYASFIERTHALERWCMRMLGRGAFRIFDIRLDVRSHGHVIGERPVLVFARHSGSADTILCSLLLSAPYGIRLRHVLKRSLLWNACVDIVGNRLPNAFVTRESSQSEHEIAAIAALGSNLGPNDGVLLYPEGTRFSPARKARAAASLRDHGMIQAARDAERLRHVLPPRPSAAFALLDAARGADVVFVAHTGFEGAASFDRIFRGDLIGKTVHVDMDVVPAAAVPRGRQARLDWLTQRWRLMDRFIDAHIDPRIARSEAEPVRLRLVR
jgi:1-acyl-sn-glycerol-3-phosphate acyltransferase